MTGNWTDEARRRLLDARNQAGVWGYRRDTSPAVEPTALAGLALFALSTEANAPAATTAAAGWLAVRQRPNGALGVSEALPEPCWPTPYALLLWDALKQKQFEDNAARAEGWLLGQMGLTVPLERDSIASLDTTIEGWSWVPETFTWLEPTALTVLALLGRGRGAHPRVRDGLRLIGDRALESGGWNYGNTVVFGHQTRPQPTTTGLALVALARAGERPPAVDKALHYLRATLPSVRSGPSLGWGVLGLRAWGIRPPEADHWLAEAAEPAFSGRDLAPDLAPLILAAADRTLFLLGIGRDAQAAG